MNDNASKALDVDYKNLTNWANEPTCAELKQDFTDAKSESDTHVSDVKRWLDNLHVQGSAKINTPEGNSKLQPKLIRKQAEWRYCSLSEPFLSTPDVFNVAPVTYEDRDAAKQNELVLNNQFNTKINKTKFIDEYIRTAVDEGTVIVRVGWDYEEREDVRTEPTYEFTPSDDPSTMAQYQQLASLAQSNPESFASQVPEHLQEALRLSMESGQMLVPIENGTKEVTETVTVRNQPTLEICDFRNVVIDPSCGGDFSKARFVVFSFETSLDELKRDGKYENLDKVNITNSTILGNPDHVASDNSSFNFNDEPRKKFVAHEYWGYWDIDGTGTVKPIVATWVGDVLIRMEDNPFPDQALPFVVIPYLPVRKSLHGQPDGELLEDNQKIIGAVTRGMIDILGKSANGQTGVRKDALDLTNKRRFDKGLDYEFNANVDPRQAIFMHTYPEIPNSAQIMLQLQNSEAESLTGVKAFNNGISGQALGDTATGIRGALDAASKRELGILRRLADGVIQIGRKFIAMNAEFLSEEEIIRITNEEFVTVRRDDLSGSFDLKLSISTAEEDNQKAQELAFMLQTMGNSMDPTMSQMILSDIARLRKMPDLAKKIEDYQPQPDPIEQQRAQLELAKLQAEIAELQSRVVENQAQAQLDMAKAGSEQVKAGNVQADTDIKNLDFVEQESGVKQERDLQKQGEQAKSNAKLEMVKASLNQNKQTN
tara:strand:+ start:487 stop:2622 length:2136 start_codon:yes stop_codon:yes gene_type:complete